MNYYFFISLKLYWCLYILKNTLNDSMVKKENRIESLQGSLQFSLTLRSWYLIYLFHFTYFYSSLLLFFTLSFYSLFFSFFFFSFKPASFTVSILYLSVPIFYLLSQAQYSLSISNRKLWKSLFQIKEVWRR